MMGIHMHEEQNQENLQIITTESGMKFEKPQERGYSLDRTIKFYLKSYPPQATQRSKEVTNRH